MTAHRWVGFVLLWLAGIDLRLTVLAVPPLLPLIHRDLRLTEAGVATLTGLPVVLFAIAAVLGSLCIARWGARRTMIVGTLGVALASGLRGLGPSIAMLFGMTFFMGVGVAIAQPAIPSLVDRWFPTRVGLATAVYVNGILVGETLSASLTLPVALPLLRHSWELSFALWGALVLLTIAPMARLSSLLPDAAGDQGAAWWPHWRTPKTWQLGLLMGGASSSYFAANAFIPDFLRAIGRPALVGACLTALNVSQLPASLAAALVASRAVGRRGPFLAIGVGMLVGLGVFFLPHGRGVVIGAGMLGFCFALALALSLALPPILADRGEVHRLSAGMYAIAYMYSFVAPLAGGLAWDLTAAPAISFLPVAVGALTILG
ncbi:MAG TPA: MFS transporter, partial [bacterium]|nr:MFS transporter [bacterium]